MMIDNDFPLMSKETSNPRSPYDVYRRPKDEDDKYGPPPEGFERPTPVKNAGAAGSLKDYVAGSPSFEIPGGKSPYNYPVLPKENPEDVPMRFTYPTSQPKLPMASNPFGISDDELERRKALRDIIDKPGYDPATVLEAQKQWIQLMRLKEV